MKKILPFIMIVAVFAGCATGLETYKQPSRSSSHAKIKSVHRSNFWDSVQSSAVVASVDGLFVTGDTTRVTPGMHKVAISSFIKNAGSWNGQTEVDFEFLEGITYYTDARDRGDEIEILIRAGAKDGEILLSQKVDKHAAPKTKTVTIPSRSSPTIQTQPYTPKIYTPPPRY